jgi:hypothetical protein
MRPLSRRGGLAAAAVGAIGLAPSPARPALAQGLGGKPPPADPNPPPTPTRRYADANRCGDGSAFEVVNLSGATILEVYLRQSGGTGWGEDRLGERALRRGERLSLDPGAGRVDLLLLRAHGRAFLAMRQDPCAISRVTLAPDDRVVTR